MLPPLASGRAVGGMSAGRDEMLAGALPPALEVMTAFTQSGEDPGFFWHAVQRVLGEPLDGGDPAETFARLTFGLSALSGILLEEIAEATGRDQAQVLADIHRGYLAS
jgi:hypothetical protein